jgi:hypothetical protein
MTSRPSALADLLASTFDDAFEMSKPRELSAPEEIRTPNLLIRSHGQMA